MYVQNYPQNEDTSLFQLSQGCEVPLYWVKVHGVKGDYLLPSSHMCRRNQNYHDILKGMGALKHKQLSQFDLTNQFTHLFFLGDLNYRIDLGATEIVEYAKKREHHTIYTEDQLRKEREKKSVFVGFGRSRLARLLHIPKLYCIWIA